MRKLVHVFTLLALFALLFCTAAGAELNWSTEKPEGRYLTRTQWSYRWDIPPYSQDWCDWLDYDVSYYKDWNGYEVKSRTLYAPSDGVFVLGTSDRMTMLEGTGAQMAFPADIYNYYWRTTNKSVASVDQDGYVSAHQAGFATIEVYENSQWAKTPAFTVDVDVMPSTGFVLPSDIHTIDEEAFSGDDSIQTVDLRGTKVDVIGGKAFADTSMQLMISDGGNISVDGTAFDGSDQVTFAVTALGSISDHAIENGHPCYLIGEEEPAVFIPVSSIERSGFDQLEVGETGQAWALALPYYADNTTLEWSSSAPDIVSITDDHTLVAHKAGTAVITISSTDGSGVENSFTFTVIQKASGISLNYTTISMHKGEEVELIGTIYPEDTTNTKIYYTSDDDDVAYIYGGVDASILHAQGIGTTVIHAKTGDESAEATCTVTVRSYGDDAKYTSFWSSDVLANSAKINAKVQLPSGHNPATFGYYLGTSSNSMTKRETESGSGLSYTIENIFYTCQGLSPSTTYYYRFFMNYDGKEYLSNIGSFTTPAGASISFKLSEMWINTNENIQLNEREFTVSPSNATITWSSSDSSICSVDQNGKIHSINSGHATITATATANGTTSTDSFIVYVIK